MDIIQERKRRIVEFMKEAAYRPLKFDELAGVLAVPSEEKDDLAEILGSLEIEGKIYKTNKDRYGIPERMNLVVGRLQGNERGFGFLIPDDPDAVDVFIPAEGLSGAMHNDRVIARITAKGTEGRRAEGEVIKILKRAVTKVVGTFESSRYFGFVVPDDKRIPGDIFIPKDEVNGARPGFKVVAEITKWPERRRNAEGRITEIIGDSRDTGVDILSIMKTYGLTESFPDDVMQQAAGIPDSISEEMRRGRRDLRDLRMITIDGEDAKDLDDAVSIQKLPDGCYRLGVHIADVSYYVTEDSPLDKEALKRGTSVYLVDRVIPMLPKKLSNGVCSLNPNVDRLAFTVMMDIDDKGKVLKHDIFESVIKTNERMTYTDVYKLLETADTALLERYGYLMDDLRAMKELALILRSKRVDRGAIDFDFDEAKVIVDENGKPIYVKRYEITIANRIIEEFMLVCNETVAEHFHWLGVPFVYRIHEEPDPEKIMAFAEFAKNLGYPLKGINHIHPGALQDLLDKVRGSREEMIVSTVMLRSMAKARYSNQNIGHFGLAARFYCHFTSPIRRYPDLIIHRLMKEELKGGLTEERESYLTQRLPDIAISCSERERAADEAERETEDLKKVEYMREKLGETFEGIISNVTSFGMFVELENTIEGLVKVSSLYDDYYVFDDRRYHLTGERTGKRYRIGDAVRVILARADIAARQLEFVIADQVENRDDETKRGKDGKDGKNGKSGKNGNGKVFLKKDLKNYEAGAGHTSGGRSGSGRKRGGSLTDVHEESHDEIVEDMAELKTKKLKKKEEKKPKHLKEPKQLKKLKQLKQPKQLDAHASGEQSEKSRKLKAPKHLKKTDETGEDL
jgi:ribonuclease R